MKRLRDCFWTLLFAAATVGFALMAHRAAWMAWRWAFLALAGAAICGGWVSADDPIGTIFGRPRGKRLGWWVVAATGLAVFAAAAYRWGLGERYFPSSLGWFAVVAMAIGAVEELLWRGWMQGTLAKTCDSVPLLRRSSADCDSLPGTACEQAAAHDNEECGLSSLAGVFVAAGSHAAYKTALFVFPPDGIARQTSGSLLFLAATTFGFGAVLGFSRVRQGTIAAPVVFHVLFDLLVYGQYVSGPWWVWQ
jgi:membrane protease YdiL (CAAX protease family)